MLSALPFIAFALQSTAVAQSTRDGRSNRGLVAHATDSIADAVIKRGRVAALSVGVIRGRDTLVMKGYGMAEIENDVPATARTV
jgi:CubicO group peptidase (beta-lactamase class C family)